MRGSTATTVHALPSRPKLTIRSAALATFIVAAGCSVPGFHVERGDRLEAYLDRAAERPVLVVDIDDTIVKRGFWSSLRLWAHAFYLRDHPLAGAPAALKVLETRWNVIFLTARDDSLQNQTLAWLDANGFPRAPVIFSERMLYRAGTRGEFKRRAIESLLARGLAPGWGIGDKAGDLTAYRKNGLRTVLILDGPQDPDLDRTFEALGVSILPSPAAPDLLLFDHANAWEEIGNRLGRPQGSPQAGGPSGRLNPEWSRSPRRSGDRECLFFLVQFHEPLPDPREDS